MFRFSIQLICSCAALVLVPACQTFRFYGQAVGGQVEILRKSRPSDRVIADSATPSGLRQRLVTVERIRRFASEQLALPGDESYGKYADLGRKHVVWVLYAAPEFSLEPKTWLYPAVGELDYRGYFREQDTVALAEQLRGDGYDVFIGGVDAYSTLGWFHDPVLNTFVNYPDVDLAETILHELTHRRIFHRGATAFNESLANVVAEEGVRRWLAHEGRLAELRQYEARLGRRREFYAEVVRSRQRLEALYASAQSDTVKRREKAVILNTLREQVGELWRRWGSPGLEAWLAQNLNNGHLVSLKIYADRMPRFRQLLAERDGDFERFFRLLRQVDPHPETAETSCPPAATSRKLNGRFRRRCRWSQAGRCPGRSWRRSSERRGCSRLRGSSVNRSAWPDPGDQSGGFVCGGNEWPWASGDRVGWLSRKSAGGGLLVEDPVTAPFGRPRERPGTAGAGRAGDSGR